MSFVQASSDDFSTPAGDRRRMAELAMRIRELEAEFLAHPHHPEKHAALVHACHELNNLIQSETLRREARALFAKPSFA